MINVSEETKLAYMSDVSKKRLRVYFPDFLRSYGNESIKSESFKLTESLSTRDSIEFVGCISTSMEVDIYGISENVKGKRIEVYISADDTEEIPLFKGFVDSAVINSDKMFKKITAYDALYDKGQRDIAKWYEGLWIGYNRRTLKEIRTLLFGSLGIPVVETSLPNDDIVIEKQYAPTTLQALTVVKSICQINGCCGIVNRYGQFEYRFIVPISKGLYPSATLFPSADTIPGHKTQAHTFPFYNSLKFEEYFVKAMARVQIRESEEDNGYTAGAEEGNKYIIQGNMFSKGLSGDDKKKMADRILKKLKRTEFFPFEAKNYGLPFVEVGDCVEYVLSADRTGRYATNSFIVLERTLSGVQLLNDVYNATSTEEQSEFVTDLQAQLDSIKRTGVKLENYYDKDAIDEKLEEYMTAEETIEQLEDMVDDMETPTGVNIVSVYSLPSTRNPDTIYLIQGGVIIR